jgi:uncharacterized membrane protein
MKLCSRKTPSLCESVIVSTYGSVLNMPLPVLGLCGFTFVMALLVFSEGKWALQLVLGVAGAIAGAALLAIQVGPLGQLCLFCVITDVAAIALGCVIAIRRLTGQRLDNPLSAMGRRKWVFLAFLSLFASLPAWIIVGAFEAC